MYVTKENKSLKKNEKVLKDIINKKNKMNSSEVEHKVHDTQRVFSKHQSKPYRFLQNENRTLKMRMHSPKVDLSEKNDTYVVRMELAGFTLEQVQVSVKDKQFVLVSGHKKQEMDSDTQVVYMETKYGDFTRRVKLPSVVDSQNFHQKMENGVLTLVFTKVDIQ
jgi:HSP20 family molecular chaperone IbpA